MDPENSLRRDMQAAILADSQAFLESLRSGAPDEHLTAILDRIKDRELRLIAEHGLRLTPEVWKILQGRLAKRRSNDIVDPGPDDRSGCTEKLG